MLQTTLEGNKDITGQDMCLTDLHGVVLAATCQQDEEKLLPLVSGFAAAQTLIQEEEGLICLKVMDGVTAEYILIVASDSPEGRMCGKLVVFQLQELMSACREKFDIDNFMKNLLLDNLLLVDIYNRAQKLHIEIKKRRVVYLIEAPKGMYYRILEKIRTLYKDSPSDYITAVDEKNIVLVRELEKAETLPQLHRTAAQIRDRFSKRETDYLRISFGTMVSDLREVSRSYKEARMALEVGRIFYPEREIVPYSTLGIGRLIYQLPMSLCQLYTREIFGAARPEDLDEELQTTINKFFECSLNVSETSRQLFIHRNTLVYRLEKISKMTGLDLRTFEDAITFKIGLMVLSYMKEMETEE
jgi:carbohydrate diacid regulator